MFFMYRYWGYCRPTLVSCAVTFIVHLEFWKIHFTHVFFQFSRFSSTEIPIFSLLSLTTCAREIYTWTLVLTWKLSATRLNIMASFHWFKSWPCVRIITMVLAVTFSSIATSILRRGTLMEMKVKRRSERGEALNDALRSTRGLYSFGA